MKSSGVKVLFIGFVIFLVSTVLGLYLAWFQYDMYVVKEVWTMQELKNAVTGYLITQMLSVIGALTATIGVAILLREKPSTT